MKLEIGMLQLFFEALKISYLLDKVFFDQFNVNESRYKQCGVTPHF